jgi:hypothetical protein
LPEDTVDSDSSVEKFVELPLKSGDRNTAITYVQYSSDTLLHEHRRGAYIAPALLIVTRRSKC